MLKSSTKRFHKDHHLAVNINPKDQIKQFPQEGCPTAIKIFYIPTGYKE